MSSLFWLESQSYYLEFYLKQLCHLTLKKKKNGNVMQHSSSQFCQVDIINVIVDPTSWIMILMLSYKYCEQHFPYMSEPIKVMPCGSITWLPYFEDNVFGRTGISSILTKTGKVPTPNLSRSMQIEQFRSMIFFFIIFSFKI